MSLNTPREKAAFSTASTKSPQVDSDWSILVTSISLHQSLSSGGGTRASPWPELARLPVLITAARSVEGAGRSGSGPGHSCHHTAERLWPPSVLSLSSECAVFPLGNQIQVLPSPLLNGASGKFLLFILLHSPHQLSTPPRSPLRPPTNHESFVV